MQINHIICHNTYPLQHKECSLIWCGRWPSLVKGGLQSVGGYKTEPDHCKQLLKLTLSLFLITGTSSPVMYRRQIRRQILRYVWLHTHTHTHTQSPFIHSCVFGGGGGGGKQRQVQTLGISTATLCAMYTMHYALCSTHAHKVPLIDGQGHAMRSALR